MANKQLVVGNGVLGRRVASLIAASGQRPLVLSRTGGSSGDWDVATCDVSEHGQLAEHLDGPTTLFLCAAPKYWLWQIEFPRIVRGVENACAGRRVDIVYADDLYAYGKVSGPIGEQQAYRPCAGKGGIRRGVARRLMALHGEGDVRVSIVRASDFFGPGVLQSALGRDKVRRLLAGKPARLLGSPDVPHAYTYIDDFANALVTLSQRDEAYGACWHAPTHNLPSTRALLEMIARHGKGVARMKVLSPWLMNLIGVFNPAVRELPEMRYLFDEPLAVSFEETAQRFGLTLTPLEEAVAATVEDAR